MKSGGLNYYYIDNVIISASICLSLKKERQVLNMDYQTFITAAAKHINKMDEKQKTEWIYEAARTTPKTKRQAFLDRLCGNKKYCYPLNVKQINNWCDQISDGTVCMIKERQEYQYAQDATAQWEAEYTDDEGIIPFLEQALQSVYQMLMNRDYKTTENIITRLLSLEITCIIDSDHESACEKLSVKALIKAKLLKIDLKRTALIMLYACYQNNTGQKRIHQLYHCFNRKECRELVLSDVFAFGPAKIKDEAEFMNQWCTYLKQQRDERAASLLIDACFYIGGVDYLLKCAEECAKIHPSLYLAYCQYSYQNNAALKCIEAAKTALTLIETDKAIRSDICVIAASASKQIHHKDKKLFCAEAFYAKPDLESLFTLISFNDSTINQKAFEIIKTMKVSHDLNDRSQHRKATMRSEALRTVCRFMLGDYRELIRLCKQNHFDQNTDAKDIISVLLLLALKQSKTRTLAEIALIRQLIARISYKDTYEAFETTFSKWQNSFQLSDTEKQAAIRWLHQEITDRVTNILAGNYRQSYWKAAALFIVLGIVEEECGEVRASECLKQDLQMRHANQSAFWNEMKELTEFVKPQYSERALSVAMI